MSNVKLYAVFGINPNKDNGVGFPPTTPIEELDTVKEFVDMDRPVPLGLVFGFILTVMEVANIL